MMKIYILLIIIKYINVVYLNFKVNVYYTEEKTTFNDYLIHLL